MTDDGLIFTATITTPTGETLHRETPIRRELLDWLAAHGHEGTITRLGMEATGPGSVHAMTLAIVAGQVKASKARGAAPPPEFPDRLLGLPAVRELAGGVARSTIWRWTRTEGLPVPTTVGGRHLWSEREVLRWIQLRLLRPR